MELLGLNRNPAAGKGTPVVVDGKALAQLGCRGTKLIDFREVVRRFGIARSRVKRLVEAGLIHPVHGAKPDGFGRWAFDGLHIDAFLAELEHRVVPPRKPDWEEATFERVRASGWHHGIELKDILLMVLNGRLVPRAIDQRERGLKRLVFDMAEWLEVANGIDVAKTASLSVPEAAKRLGLKQQVVYHLAKSELVETVFAMVGGKMALRVTASAVETFWDVHVTGANLAKARRTSPRSLAAKLAESGVLPIAGPAVDGSRQNIYRIADVSALA